LEVVQDTVVAADEELEVCGGGSTCSSCVMGARSRLLRGSRGAMDSLARV